MNLSKKSDNLVSNRLDWIKWFFVWAFGLITILINFYFSAQPSWLLAVVDVAGLILIFLTASLTGKGKRFWVFVKEAKIEIHKIVWSTPKETLQSAVMVVIVVLIAAVFLWGVDSFLLWVLNFFTGQRG